VRCSHDDKKFAREFLKLSASAAGACALSARSYARCLAQQSSANGRHRFFRSFSRSALPAFLKHAGVQQFEIVALSDIWKRRRDEGVNLIQDSTGHAVAICHNNDELYDRKDVDAVIIATPIFSTRTRDRSRSKQLGCVRGKPMAHTMEDAREFRKTQRQTGRVCRWNAAPKRA